MYETSRAGRHIFIIHLTFIFVTVLIIFVPAFEYIHSEVILSSHEGSHLYSIVLVIVDVWLLLVILSALIVYWVL